MNIIALPYEYFADPNRGRPLFNAQIYIGVVDTDPFEIPNRVDVFYVQEDGAEVILQQPIRTSPGGLTVNDSGDVVQIRTANDYSMRVFDSRGSEVIQYNTPNNTETGGATIGFVNEAINERFNNLPNELVTSSGSSEPRTLADRFADVVNVKDFGAVGDGVADDTEAIQAALNTGKLVIINEGAYLVSSAALNINSSIAGTGNPVIQFVGRRNDFATINTNGVTVEGVTFKGGSELFTDTTESNFGAIKIAANTRDVLFSKCRFTDMTGKLFGGTYALRISADGCKVTIDRCHFARIKSFGTNPPQEGVGPGFCGGIDYGNETDVTNMSEMLVNDCTFEDIETIRHPDASPTDPLDFDSDAIRFFAPQTDYETSPRANVRVLDCSFVNVQKRCIKNTGVDGLVVDGLDVTAFNTSDSTRLEMAAIVSMQPAKSANISNVRANGRFIYGFRINPSRTVISNVNFDQRYVGYGGYFIGLEDRTNILERDITVENCNLLGFQSLVRSITLSPGDPGSNDLQNIKFNNIDFAYSRFPRALTVEDLVFLSDVRLLEVTNVKFRDYAVESGVIERDGFRLNRCEGVLFDNVVMPCDQIGIDVTSTGDGSISSRNFTIRNCDFTRGLINEDAGTEFIRFESTETGIDIRNTILRTRSYLLNSNARSMLRVGSNGAYLEGITIQAEPRAGSEFFPFGMITVNANDAFIKDCKLNNSDVSVDSSFLLEFIGSTTSGHRVIDCHSNDRLATGGVADQYSLMTNCTANSFLGEDSFLVAVNNTEY